MRFEVLGPVRINDGNGASAALTPRHRTLLAALLTARSRPMSTERLVTELWPDGAPASAGAALQVYVSGLRKILGDRLRTVDGGYLLEAADVDAADFEALLAATGDRHAALTAALALWRGPAFDGVAAGPAITAAEARLAEQLLAARREWAELTLAADGAATALVELTGWVAEHPTAEPLIAQLMLALHRSGRTADALVAYDRATAALADFGTEPGTELSTLAAAIRRHDPTLELPGARLPAGRNRFIGRRAELDRAIALLGASRLLTVVGPGGSGKTRLSVEMAREAAPDHPGGVHVVEFAGYTAAEDPDALTARVAAATGAREVPGEPVAVSLARHLGAGRCLLVLDNCEHVRPEAAALVHDLLAACPGVRVVATSREPLGLPAEVVFPLGGLTRPAPGDPPDVIVRTDAVRLLADRVTAARGGGALRPDEVPIAAELCRRLDGLPLALELAAARLRAFSLAEISARLDRSLDLLVGTSPVGRHQTMRAAIDWGHELLDEPQRVLLRRLSVFAGGFGLAAAERVGDDPAVLDLLSQLVDRSLVERVPAGDRSRFRIIETIREYAAERLTRDGGPTEAAATRDRHAAVWADLLAAPAPVDGPAHSAWLATVGAEHDNIRAALEWTLDSTTPERGLSLATAMWWYWWITGSMVEGRAWLGRALQATPADPTALRGTALRVAASLARNSGDLTAARALGEQGLATFRSLGDGPGTIAALNNLSITAQGQGDFEASLAYGYEGLRLATEPRPIAIALNNTAGTLRCLGRLDEAAQMFTRGLAGFRAIGDRRGEAAALSNLAIVDRRRGEPASSRELMLQALDIYTELGIDEGRLDAVEGLAQLDIRTGAPAAGLRLLAVAERERTALGAPIFTPDEIADRDDAEQAARAALTSAEIADAYRRATATTLDEAVASLRRT
ncbi:BTAD domain-containing putative transcriptional regulator [Micromonosporaceae bacterium Da 78-11]